MVFIKKNIHWIALIALGIGGYLLYKNQADKKEAEKAAKKKEEEAKNVTGFAGRTDKPNALGI